MVTITNNTNSIDIEGNQIVESVIKANILRITSDNNKGLVTIYDGIPRRIEIKHGDVSSPVTADANALRVALLGYL